VSGSADCLSRGRNADVLLGCRRHLGLHSLGDRGAGSGRLADRGRNGDRRRCRGLVRRDCRFRNVWDVRLLQNGIWNRDRIERNLRRNRRCRVIRGIVLADPLAVDPASVRILGRARVHRRRGRRRWRRGRRRDANLDVDTDCRRLRGRCDDDRRLRGRLHDGGRDRRRRRSHRRRDGRNGRLFSHSRLPVAPDAGHVTDPVLTLLRLKAEYLSHVLLLGQEGDFRHLTVRLRDHSKAVVGDLRHVEQVDVRIPLEEGIHLL